MYRLAREIVATPPPHPVLRGMWQLTWLGGVDSFKARNSSGFSQVSVRKSIWMFLSVISSFISAPFDVKDRMLIRPSFRIVQVSLCADKVCIFIRLSWLIFILVWFALGLYVLGIDTVCIWFNMGKECTGAAKVSVVCLPVLILGCQ